VFLRARNSESGVVITYPDSTLYYFDLFGRLAKISDRNTTKLDGSDGNTMTFSYNMRWRGTFWRAMRQRSTIILPFSAPVGQNMRLICSN
jgi:hypothetical protein